MKSEKKHYSSEFKAKVILEYLEEQIPAGKLCEKYNIHPNIFTNWKKEFYNNAFKIYEKAKTNNQDAEQIKKLEEKLRKKEEVINEIIEDNIYLKKKLNGEK